MVRRHIQHSELWQLAAIEPVFQLLERKRRDPAAWAAYWASLPIDEHVKLTAILDRAWDRALTTERRSRGEPTEQSEITIRTETAEDAEHRADVRQFAMSRDPKVSELIREIAKSLPGMELLEPKDE